MIPYYLPQLTPLKFIKAIFRRNSLKLLEDYFKGYSGKKFVLVTSSARSALYLAYKSLGITGEVITSPLTCLSALDPILKSGNTVRFIDISGDTLNMDLALIETGLSDETLALQVIHLGGYSQDVNKIRNKLEGKEVLIIEDCAQGFGATSNGANVGTQGDVACYSLIKNFYGIGGGILATNDRVLYNNAKAIQGIFPHPSSILIYYRIIRNIIETFRTNFVGEKLYRFIIRLKECNVIDSEDTFTKTLHKPHKLYTKIACVQLAYLRKCHKLRKEKAIELVNDLQKNKLMSNYRHTNLNTFSFTKLYIHLAYFVVPDYIQKLNKSGIEAKHLEHRYGSFYQERLDLIPAFRRNASLQNCKKYFQVHDSLISIPVHENLTKKEIVYIVTQLREISNNGTTNNLD